MTNQDNEKTREQLVQELAALRRRVAELEEIAKRYLNLFEYSGESIFVVDPITFQILDVNTNAARRLGYRREELLQLTLDDLETPGSEDESHQEMAWESVVSGTTFYERLYRHKGGRQIPMEVGSRLVCHDQHEVLLNFARDITERKEAQAALRQYAADLEARNEELDAYARTVAHDLRNPLSTIIGYAQFYAESWSDLELEEQGLALQTIARSAEQAVNTVDSLLLLARVREGDVALSSLDMTAILSRVRDRLLPLIERHQGQIFQPATWPLALGYGPWIEEVWINYISNGLKYGGQPPQLELGAAPQPEEMIRFWVCDQGPGITHQDQARLFTEFTRLRHDQPEGHGLGLSIVRRIVEKLGGEVGVESSGVPGQGSTFYFTLPSAPAGDAAFAGDR